MTMSARPSAPTVDIGMPVWRHSIYLEQAIASIEHQTLPSWRLHISQDGGPEPSVAKLIAGRHNPRIDYSATERAVGAAQNKTRLLRTGDAPYIALLDHDDAWEQDFLRRRVEFLERNPSCAFVFSPLVVIDAEGAVLARGPRVLADGVYSSTDIVPLLLSWDGIPGGSVVARRSAYDEVGAEFCAFLPRTYDYEMWVRLALRFPVGYLGLSDAYWRRHHSNASSDLRGYDKEYERLISHLSRLVARDRPELSTRPDIWPGKLSALLLMTSSDALALGERRLARHYLSLAIRRDLRGTFRARTIAVALRVTLGRPGTALVAGGRRIKYLRGLRRALAD
jgi:glycosyltransferase involved in cell wall biosynthesis